MPMVVVEMHSTCGTHEREVVVVTEEGALLTVERHVEPGEASKDASP